MQENMMVKGQDSKKDHNQIKTMKLSQINLRGVYKSKVSSEFVQGFWAIPELYWSLLKNYDTGDVQKINIIVFDSIEEKLVHTMSVKNFKEACIHFDFYSYKQMDNFKKKKTQLEVVHKGMMEIAEKEGWGIDPLLDAYNKCLEKNMEYKFYVGKPKNSPDKKHKISFWTNWDIDTFEVYWVLQDKYGNEIKCEKFIEKKPCNGEFIYYSKFKWTDNQIVLFEDKYKYGTNEIWEIKPFK